MPTVLVTGPNGRFFPDGGQKTIANIHSAYPQRDGQAELTWVVG